MVWRRQWMQQIRDAANLADISNITSVCSRRAEADISAIGDPNTGVSVYDTYSESGWLVFGGTSVATPIIATVFAVAGNASTVGGNASYLYSHTANFFDVTSGSNGTCWGPCAMRPRVGTGRRGLVPRTAPRDSN